MTPPTAVQGQGCPLCEAPLAARNLREVSAGEEPMRLTLRHLPVLECAVAHRYFVGHDFPAWLLDALLQEELAKVPAGNEKGLVFRKFACGGCGAELPATAGEPMTFSSTLEWEQALPFVVDITVPIVICPSCGMEQARSGAELAKLLPLALVHAFKEAGIKSPG